jgi:GTPase SAR1 family protein
MDKIAPHLTLIFGCASIGSTYTTKESVSEMLSALKLLDITRIDTAARYPSTNPGASERLLGEAGAAAQVFTIDTKIIVLAETAGSLEPAAVDKSLRENYERLKLKNAACHVQALFKSSQAHFRDRGQRPVLPHCGPEDATRRSGRWARCAVQEGPL